jgi:uncharacterized phage protein (TIGR01671 family)
MEDRYLFRAKRIDNGERIIGSLLVDKQQDIGTGEQIEIIGIYPSEYKDFAKKIDPSTICQCTGLKDKNSNLIWENDIVKCVDENNDIEFTAIIEFGNPNGLYSWGYQLQHIKGDEPNLDILLWVDMEEAGATCKVIGNKFDNPELLEVQE